MPRLSRKKWWKKETSAPNPKKHLEYEASQGGVVRENTLPVHPPDVTQISIFNCPHRWYRRPMIGPSIETKTGGNVGLPGLAGGPDLSFGFPWNGGIPCPHQVTWSQPINMRLARKRKPIRGKLKSPRTPKFEKKPVKVWANKITLQTCNQSA